MEGVWNANCTGEWCCYRRPASAQVWAGRGGTDGQRMENPTAIKFVVHVPLVCSMWSAGGVGGGVGPGRWGQLSQHLKHGLITLRTFKPCRCDKGRRREATGGGGVVESQL